MLKFSSSTQGIEISGRMRGAKLGIFKNSIPKHHRNFDWVKKCWYVDNSRSASLTTVFPSHANEINSLNLLSPKTSTKILRVYYIGSTKPDFNDMARGTMNPRGDGEWFAIFPKDVLEDWFDFGFVPEPPKQESSDLSGNYYEVLGVQKTDDLKTIKKSYRRMAFKYHPDRYKDDEWKFLRVTEAKDVLVDPDKRKIYDAGLALEEMTSPKAQKKRSYTPFDYIPPQRCGDILVEAEEKLGLYFVKKIIAWHQITKNGKILETRWSNNQVKMDWV